MQTVKDMPAVQGSDCTKNCFTCPLAQVCAQAFVIAANLPDRHEPVRAAAAKAA